VHKLHRLQRNRDGVTLVCSLCAGVSEIVKYGLIRDAELFEWLEANMGKLLARDPAAVAHAVEQSCINKVRVSRNYQC
jgi:3-dehydroquinate synthetase